MNYEKILDFKDSWARFNRENNKLKYVREKVWNFFLQILKLLY